MGARWRHLLSFQLPRLLFTFLMLRLQAGWCVSLNLEGLALLEFRARVEVDPYGAFENWDPKDRNPCAWLGVHCFDGKVQILNLTGFELGGMLAPEIGSLHSLKSIALCRNNFYGEIPKDFGGLSMLEVLDLSSNNLSGTIPEELWNMPSLKQLLLCDNKFQGSMPSTNMHDITVEQECEGYYLDEATKVRCLNRKFGCWLKCKNGISFNGARGKVHTNLPSLQEPHVEQDLQYVENALRRRMLHEAGNLPALSGNDADSPSSALSQETPRAVDVLSLGSGSFPAFPNSKDKLSLPSLTENFGNAMQQLSATPSNSNNNEPSLSEKLRKWAYLLVLPAVALLLSIIAGPLLVCRKKGRSAIGPWRTGLSGQLQKAFITGVPKLNRAELEAACEDFSNIINTYPECTVFKGTLSSGVEIAVISTVIASTEDWPKRSEGLFRKKIDTLSRVNHKNFINVLGYCEEDEPFMRMMVFEYAPNGTLFEHLHVKEFEHLDWRSRMRIIMGIAYCLQYMHHELNPPATLPFLQSNTIFMTDDYAAKIADVSMWKEVAIKRKPGDDDMDPPEIPLVDPGANIFSFGILLLEIISGKVPDCEEQGSLCTWATGYLNDKRHLVDPTLTNYKRNELDIICEVIQVCIDPDPKHRPTMREVTRKLREVLAISPEAATPRLSPLWWAELEILSVEAT